MTIYLLDENVLREMHSNGNRYVRAWFATVVDTDLRISVMTLFEKRQGWERRKKSAPALAATKLSELDAFEAGFVGRIVSIDRAVAAEWSRLLGAKNKNQRDRALAATARVHGFVLVTRNIDDMRGCSVQVLNPFKDKPLIETV